MKILFLIESLGRGGAEQVLVNTLPELKKLGFECAVATLFERHELADELEGAGIAVHRLKLSHKWNIVEALYKLNCLLRRNQYRIIHAHLFFAYFYAGLLKLFNPHIKTLTTFHNLGYDTYPADRLWKKARKRLDAYIVNHWIDGQVAVSAAVRQHYARHLQLAGVDIIHNSIPVELIGSTPHSAGFGLLTQYVDTERFDCISITPGRLVKEKGHRYLIEALLQLQVNCPRLCHLIVGSGPLLGDIERRIRENKLSNVLLIPGLPQHQLFALIKSCHFVVIPSVSEGFGMVVIEAMALGKAVVATQINGIAELIENNASGWLIPAGDASTLAEAMAALSQDRVLRDNLAENARQQAKRFDAPIIARQWQAYYQAMLAC